MDRGGGDLVVNALGLDLKVPGSNLATLQPVQLNSPNIVQGSAQSEKDK